MSARSRLGSWSLATLVAVVAFLADAAPAAAQTVFRVITVNGLLRGYYLHVPPSYDPAVPTPMVIMLHGYGSSGLISERNTLFSEKADAENFIVVYPNALGEPKTWAVPWSPRSGGEPEDDLAFIAALIDVLPGYLNIDPNRVFVAGISSGAHMAQFVGSRLSDRVAAIASVGGAAGSTILGVYREAGLPDYPLSVLLLHGIDDPIVPYYGGRGESFPLINWVSAGYTTWLWVVANGCLEEPESWIDPDETMLIDIYRKGFNATEVILVTVFAGQHDWQILGDSMATTDAVWAFFASHARQ